MAVSMIIFVVVIMVMVMLVLGWLFRSMSRTAASLAVATCISTVQQACICIISETTRLAGLLAHCLGTRLRRLGLEMSIIIGGCRVVVLRVQAELWLDGGRVNAVLMETVANGASELHVSCGTFSLEIKVDLNVQACNQLGVAQLPNMNVVAANDARQELNVFLNLVNIDAKWNSLEKDARGGLAEWNGRGENDTGDEKRDCRVQVEAP